MIDWSATRASILGETSCKGMLPDVKLPVLPKAVSEFSQKAEAPDCCMRELAAIVEADSGLTVQLLRNVNSSANGLKHRVAKVQHAITALGVRRTKLFLVTAALQNALPVRQLKLINLAAFWNTNLERALLAKRLARLLKTDEELAFAAGLLQDFLLPILTNELDTHYVEFLKAQETSPIELIEFEKELFGWDHGEAAARVMFDWGFPDDLICCILFHHHGLTILADKELGRSPAAAVALSGLMPDVLRQCPDGMDNLARLSDIWKAFDLHATAEDMYEEYESQALESANYIPFKVHCERLRKDAEDKAANEPVMA